MNNDTIIGQNVRRYRRAASPDITQAALASHIDLSPNSISRYENGGEGLLASDIPHIAALLGCEIVDLFEGTEGRS